MTQQSILPEIGEAVMQFAKRLPNPPRDQIVNEFMKIQKFLLESRPPRFLIVGRRGSGKSSLINAIFGKRMTEIGSVLSETGSPKWYTFESEQGKLEILDTRGFGDMSRPDSAQFEHALDEMKETVKQECPDVILFLVKAKEVDAHIEQDINSIIELKKFINSTHKYDIPVVALVTQVDELDPKRIEPPYDHPVKKENISKAIEAISKAFESCGIDLVRTIPISTYAEYEGEALVYHNLWNVELLITYLIDILPKTATLELARLSRVKSVQIKLARIIIGSTATITSGIAATPIPVADLLPITGAQIAMIMGVAHISGKKLSRSTAKEFLVALGANVGGGLVLREISRGLIKLMFPAAGSVVSAGVAFAGTWAIGEAAVAYFIEKRSIDEAKSLFKNARNKLLARKNKDKNLSPPDIKELRE